MSVVAGLLAGVLALLSGLAVLARRRWSGETDAWTARVASASRRDAPAVRGREVSGREDPAERTPAVVARYLAAVLPEPSVATASLVRVEHEGEFNLGEGPGWRPFRSWQVFSQRAPAFVWVARIRLGPALSVQVRDAYAGGTGAMEARVHGVLKVMRAADGPELRQAALQRCLAERVWLPASLAPGGAVAWRGIDDRSAEATLVDGDVTATLAFRFDASGLPVGVFSGARYREIRGEYVPTPWEGIFADYRSYGGVLIPAESEVAWIVDGERRPYWRGRIRSVTVEPAA